MIITIKFNDDINHVYDSFEEILQIDNYNDITYINCAHNNLYYLPELPDSLIILHCHGNYLSNLPKLPNTLIDLICYNNNLSNLPELPNLLKDLHCSNNSLSNLPELPNSLQNLCCLLNNLSNLPELPNSLTLLWCEDNNLSCLPELPHTFINFTYYFNPLYTYIETYFNGNIKFYCEYQTNMKRKFTNKIGNWFLDCKYNPKYSYCRKRLMKEYEELYN